MFAVFGYAGEKGFLPLCVAVNVATNLSLNLVLSLMRAPALIFLLELIVVVVEYCVYSLLLERSSKLFCATLTANAVSFLAGYLLFGI